MGLGRVRDHAARHALGLGILLSACATPAVEAPPPVVVPMIEAHGLVFVELELPRQGAVLALFDTGANASAIDTALAAELPVLRASQVQGTTGSFAVDTVALSGLKLGGAPLPELHATRRDLSGLLAPEGTTVGMILGSDAFADASVTLDFAAGEFAWGSGAGDAPASDVPFGVPLVLDEGIPAIQGELNGHPLWLRIDTGASLFATDDVYVNVPSAVWEALHARDPGLTPSAHFSGTGADGQAVDLPVVPVPNARIARHDFERVFLIVQPRAGYFATPNAKGFVSNNFLRRLGRVTLDYARQRFVG